MHTSHGNNGSRFAELDGLRALAVVSVILFHCELPGGFSAGFFGVDIFFTISGFIITAILLKEYRDSGDIGFSRFYFRRMKRLLPPVLALLAMAWLVTPMVSADADAWLRADTPAALSYASNWWQILSRQSYFDTTPHLLKHLWSLAVEEQFYMLWPPIAYLLRRTGGRKATGWCAIALALLSTAWMGWLYRHNLDAGDQNRIYLGTDTHAMGLLAGAALACFWNPWASPPAHSAARWRVASLASLALLAYMMQTMNTSDPAMYLGSFLLVPVLTCVVAYGTMNDPAFVLSRLLRQPLVQWAGRRSYSLYLVHWVVFVWMRLLGWNHFSDWTTLVPALAVTMALAELMYRSVELPSSRFDPGPAGAGRLALAPLAYTACAVSLFMSVSNVAAPDAQPPAVLAAVAAPPARTAPPAEALPQHAEEILPDELLDTGERMAGGEDIYAVGDSVLLGARGYLAKTIPGIWIDAAIGRQASQGLKVVKEWHSKPVKASTVLVHLGTNGYINEGQYKELLQEVSDRKSVIVINVHADRRWTAQNNELIERVSHEFPNVHLIDWNAISAHRPDYFVKDGIHLTHKGILALTAEIKAATGGANIPDGIGTGTMLADAGHARPPAHKPAEPETRRHAAEAKAGAPARAPADADGGTPPERHADDGPADTMEQPNPSLKEGPG